jgi:hypothetical protein
MPQLEVENAEKASMDGIERQKAAFNLKQELIQHNIKNSIRVLRCE